MSGRPASSRVRARRLELLRDLYKAPATRAELEGRHPCATSDLTHLLRLGLIDKQTRDHPLVPLWSFRGAGS